VPDNWYIAAVVMTAAAVTWALRALPFAVLAPLRRSKFLPYLGARMPVGVMAILVVYTLRHVRLTDAASVAPATAALLVTAGLHLWRRNAVLSILVGTAVNVVIATAMAG
jgi:branched-subunit amino acid transport protein AzlD